MGEYLTAPAPTKEMPKGIPYIIGNEIAERFSFYGMKTILFVFMTQYLMSSTGEPAFFTETEARQYQGWFVSAAYLTPLIGAFISDALWGKYKTILYLSLFYCVGHGTLALMDLPGSMLENFLEPRVLLMVGLVLIAFGSGGIKPCVSANVGDQFGESNKHLISRVYSWFYFSINFGSFFSSMLTPWLLDVHGPALAFGIPGILMGIATLVFWIGRKRFVHIPPTGAKQFVGNVLDRDGLSALLRLAPIFILVAVYWSCYDQSTSAWTGQATRMDRLLGIEWLESQIQAINALLVLAFIPLFAFVVYPLLDKLWTMTPLRKIGIGMFMMVVTFGFSAVIEQWTIDAREAFDRDHAARIEAGEADLVETLVFLEANGRPKAAQALVGDLFGRARVELYTENTDAAAASTWNLDTLAALEMRWKALDDEIAAQAVEPAEEVLRRVALREELTAALQGEQPIVLADGQVADAQAQANAAPEAWFSSGAVVYRGAAGQLLHRPSIVWQLLAWVLLTASEVMVYLTLLEYSYRQAPNRIKSLVMACNMASIGLGNAFIALVNQFTADAEGNSTLVGASYYWFFTACMLGAAVLYVVVAVVYKPKEYLQTEST
jgi:POT family proton-dependent oligopeptide transporter